MARFDLSPIVRGHWKGLTNGVGDAACPDWPARLTLVLVPGFIVGATILLDWHLSQPAPILAGISLLAGALLGAFAQLSTLRLKLTEWSEAAKPERWRVERELIDETAAHILMAATLCAVDAALLIVAMNVTANGVAVSPAWSAPVYGVLTYIFAHVSGVSFPDFTVRTYK